MRLLRLFSLGTVGIALMVASHAEAEAPNRGPRSPRAIEAPVPRRIPLFFERNVGQAAPEWDFLVRCRGYGAFVRSEGMTYSFDGHPLSVELEGGRDTPPETSGLELSARANYFVGNRPEEWVRGAPLVRGARYLDVAPGVSWAVGAHGRELEFTFEVQDAEPELRVSGAEALEVSARGDLLARMPRGLARFSAPVAWQSGALGRRAVEARYRLTPRGVRIALGPREPGRVVHVDPTVSYTSYLGGTGDDDWAAAAINADGDVLLAGMTASTDFPTTTGTWDDTPPASGARSDVFVLELGSAGDSLSWVTFLGSSYEETCIGLCVDSLGRPVVGGATYHGDFPTTQGVYKQSTALVPGGRGYLTKLSEDGSDLVWSTFSEFRLVGLALGADDRVRMVTQDSAYGLTANADVLEFSTALGAASSIGSQSTQLRCVSVDSAGNTFVAGRSSQQNVTGTEGAYQTEVAGRFDGILAKLDSQGRIAWRTFLGGLLDDEIAGVGIDADGRPTVAGWTKSSDFPTTAGAYDETFEGMVSDTGDAFVTRFTADGSRLRHSTLVGGTGNEVVASAAVHPSGAVYVAGHTTSADFPMKDAFQSSHKNWFDVFLFKLDHDESLIWSSFAGGSGTYDLVNGASLACAPNGTIALLASTNSDDVTTNSAYQSTAPGLGEGDFFYLKIPDDLSTVVTVPVIDTKSLPVWTEGVPFSQTLKVTGGLAPFTWSLLSGALPTGLELAADGTLSGTPQEAGVFSFRASVVDEHHFVAEQDLALLVNPPISIASESPFPDWTEGVPFTASLVASGGTGALTFHTISGAPPGGMSLGEDGKFSGTPTASGDFTFTVEVRDSVGAVAEREFSIHVNVPPSVAHTEIRDCTESVPFTQPFEAGGGTGELVWTLVSGTLPIVEGEVDPVTGGISGITAPAGDYEFTLGVTDIRGAVGTRTFDMRLNPYPRISSVEFPLAAIGRPYHGSLAGAGGTPPVRWRVTSSVVPPGTALDEITGRVDGIPTLDIGVPFAVEYFDNCGASATAEVFVPIAAPLNVSRSKVREDLLVTRPGRLLRFLELLGGSSLDVKVEGGFWGEQAPEVELLDAQGEPLDLAPYLRAKRKSIQAKSVPIAETGRYFLGVRPPVDFVGTASLTLVVRPMKKTTAAVTAMEENGILQFSAPAGTVADVRLRASKGSSALPAVFGLLDPQGEDRLPEGRLRQKGKGVSFRSGVLDRGGDYSLVFGTREATSGDVVVSVKLKLPKTIDFSLPDLAQGDAE